jgi:hypothetical protein
MKLREALTVGTFLAILGFPVSSFACSEVACLGDGRELRQNFVVRVTHDGKALQGVHVKVTTFIRDDHDETVAFFGTTAADGTMRIANLPPGKYGLDAELLGITAGYDCFHVGSPSSNKAKKRVIYTWGDSGWGVRQVAGQVNDLRRNLKAGIGHWYDNPTIVPLAGAKLRLQGPRDAARYEAVADANGNFSFPALPEGTYAFHLDAGKSARRD